MSYRAQTYAPPIYFFFFISPQLIIYRRRRGTQAEDRFAGASCTIRSPAETTKQKKKSRASATSGPMCKATSRPGGGCVGVAKRSPLPLAPRTKPAFYASGTEVYGQESWSYKLRLEPRGFFRGAASARSFGSTGGRFSLPCSGDVRQSRPIKARSVSKPSPWMPASLNPLRSTGATAVTTTAIELDLQPFLDLKLRHLCNVCPSFFFSFLFFLALALFMFNLLRPNSRYAPPHRLNQNTREGKKMAIKRIGKLPDNRGFSTRTL